MQVKTDGSTLVTLPSAQRGDSIYIANTTEPLRIEPIGIILKPGDSVKLSVTVAPIGLDFFGNVIYGDPEWFIDSTG